ncbi:MAG: hypothetical protein SGPRY_007513 [Prymnesium sp.]
MDAVKALESVMIEQSKLLGRETLRSTSLAFELAVTRAKLEAVEPALDRQLAERETLLLQRQLNERRALEGMAESAMLRVVEARAEGLSARLEESHAVEAGLSRRLAEREREVEALQAQLRGEGLEGASGEERAELAEPPEWLCAEEEDRVASFLQTHVLRGLLSAEPSVRERLLLGDICAHKLAQERLAEKWAVSERRCDEARSQLCSLREACRSQQRENNKLRASLVASPGAGGGWEREGGGAGRVRERERERDAALAAAEESRKVALAAEERAQQAQLALEQMAASHREEVEGWAAARAAMEEEARRREERSAAEAQAAGEELRCALLRERALHTRGIQLCQRQGAADLQRAREAWGAERLKMHEAMQLLSARAELPAGVSVGEYQMRADAIAAENQRLVGRVVVVEQALARAQADLEVREEAQRALETALSAVQAAGWQPSPSATPSFASPSATPASAVAGGGGRGGREQAMARQLVRAKLAEAEVRRKLRVCARAEVMLRREIADRDARLREIRGGEVRDGGGGEGGGGAEGGENSHLRLELARARAHASSLEMEIAVERGKGGARQDVDLQRVFARLAAAEEKNRQLSRELGLAEGRRKGGAVRGGAEERVACALRREAAAARKGGESEGEVTSAGARKVGGKEGEGSWENAQCCTPAEARADQSDADQRPFSATSSRLARATGSEGSTLAELRERGVLTGSSEETLEVMADAVADLVAQAETEP